ncbi:hypothetical protein MJO28_006966 [Puccinia striiformis f. sp. tritici]|uniref:Uncharacterized protein n=2 Tax=Puccinia striiformis f. sp. tritici TaxID=168172 RepID=A0A0L0VH21_9BASI|nr:hypothetical protein MJO28_006966 [Puccinia striiformis f. sp. tritici]KNE98506.1 hypothetical protein PSTG_08246 [Puccinia striiformis f. sp. tritici PST-78]
MNQTSIHAILHPDHGFGLPQQRQHETPCGERITSILRIKSEFDEEAVTRRAAIEEAGNSIDSYQDPKNPPSYLRAHTRPGGSSSASNDLLKTIKVEAKENKIIVTW